jgi:hypothetical protein
MCQQLQLGCRELCVLMCVAHERESFSDPWLPLREGICKTGCYRFSAPLAIHTSKRAGQRKEIQQDEVYLPEMWTECLGEAGRVLNLR